MHRIAKNGFLYILKRMYPFAVVIFLWWIVAHYEIMPKYFIPSPFKVFQIFAGMVQDGSLLRYVATSFQNAFIGLSCGVTLGLVLGSLCALQKGVYDFFVPLVAAAYPVPSIIWVPLALLWFGFSSVSLIFVVFIACFFCVFYNTLAGIKNINPIYMRVAKNLDLKGFAYFKEIIFLGSFPFILTGIRLAVGQSWRVIVGGEMLASTVKGLGWFLWISSEFFKYEQVFVGIITIGIIGVLLEKIILKPIEQFTIARWY